MILYLVYVKVAADAHDSWHAWMIDKHIPDVLDTGCFVEARMLRERDDTHAYRFEYYARSQVELDRYTTNFAPALKKEHGELFEGKVEARREILDVEGIYSATVRGDLPA